MEKMNGNVQKMPYTLQWGKNCEQNKKGKHENMKKAKQKCRKQLNADSKFTQKECKTEEAKK